MAGAYDTEVGELVTAADGVRLKGLQGLVNLLHSIVENGLARNQKMKLKGEDMTRESLLSPKIAELEPSATEEVDNLVKKMLRRCDKRELRILYH